MQEVTLRTSLLTRVLNPSNSTRGYPPPLVRTIKQREKRCVRTQYALVRIHRVFVRLKSEIYVRVSMILNRSQDHNKNFITESELRSLMANDIIPSNEVTETKSM